MKIPLLLALSIAASTYAQTISAPSAPAAQDVAKPAGTPYSITERGANSRVWERTTYKTLPSGKLVPHLDRYTELATGMHYQKDGQWVESKEEIDILPQGGAAGTQGQYKVYFPGNIYQGQIELVTPDGQHLHSRPMGISYDDGSKTVLIAQLRDSIGQLVGSNEVVYPDAFTDFKADLVCTYRKSGFESDVIFREQPPRPEQYGLNPRASRVELLTEFFDTPEPKRSRAAVNKREGISDTTLQFGKTTMGHGKAFSIGGNERQPARTNRNRSTPQATKVYKSWLHLEGRTFLVEELPYQKIERDLQSLPAPSTPSTVSSGVMPSNSPLHKVSGTRLLIPSHLVQKNNSEPIQIAQMDLKRQPGVVLDYNTVDSDQTDFTFQTGETYFINGMVTLSGTTTIEGGAVIKLSDDVAYSGLYLGGPLVCDSTADQPAIFTDEDDNTVGQIISNSNGNPASGGDNGCYQNNDCLVITYDQPTTFRGLQFNYGYSGIRPQGAPVDVWDCQFLNCFDGIMAEYDDSAPEITLHNVLFAGNGEDIEDLIGNGISIVGEQITSGLETFMTWDGSPGSLRLTNGIFGLALYQYFEAGTPTLYTNKIVIHPTGTVFKSGGNDNYYLATSSPYRNVGTAYITPDLLTEIESMTTYTPQDGGFVDNDTPDLGFHYPTAQDYDGDGLADWWEWSYFGTYAQSDTDDYDGDGSDNLYDYMNGLDPNRIQFSIQVTNCYVNHTNVQSQLNVTAGVPSSIAVLVDSTNFSGATWTSYTSSNLTLHLGTNEGWHQVWVGLRGRMITSTQTWETLSFKLDRIAPTIGITNPVPGSTTNQTIIQLQGWVNESSSIYFNMTNGVGTSFTNQPVLTTSRFYDPALGEITTNYFQCYDVPLVPGTNKFSVHATDLAGNTSTTNFSLILDISSATNPPPLQLSWPQDGTKINGTNLTLRAQTADPATTILVQIVDTNNVTNTVSGMVERDGKVWVENIPLTSGTNKLTLTATSPLGITTTTNINAIGLSAGFAINDIDNGYLQDTTIADVNGTISISGYTLWLNGVKATDNGDGTWDAYNVPVGTGGTVVLNASAIPNSDNGGNGTASGGAMSNPTSAGSLQLQWEKDRPSIVYVSTFDSSYIDNTVQGYPGDFETRTITNTAHFKSAFLSGDSGGGSSWKDNFTQYTGSSYDGRETHTLECLPVSGATTPLIADTRQLFENGTLLSTTVSTQNMTLTDGNLNFGGLPSSPFAMLCEQSASFAGSDGSPYTQSISWSYISKLHLRTGGKNIPGSVTSYTLNVSSKNYSKPILYPGDYYVGINEKDMSSSASQVMGQTPDASGNITMILPDGVDLDVTPNIIIGPIAPGGNNGVTTTVSAIPHTPGPVTVSVQAIQNASEPGYIPTSCDCNDLLDTRYGQNGYFKVSRTGDTTRSLIVRMAIGGDALQAQEYEITSGIFSVGTFLSPYVRFWDGPLTGGYFVQFGPNQTDVIVEVVPSYAPYNYGAISVDLTITPDPLRAGLKPINPAPNYTIDTQSNATVYILETDVDVWSLELPPQNVLTNGTSMNWSGYVTREDYDPVSETGSDVGCGPVQGSFFLVTQAVLGTDFTGGDVVHFVGSMQLLNRITGKLELWYEYRADTSVCVGPHPGITVSRVETSPVTLTALADSANPGLKPVSIFYYDPMMWLQLRNLYPWVPPYFYDIMPASPPWEFWLFN